jgi:hypothetical protein
MIASRVVWLPSTQSARAAVALQSPKQEGFGSCHNLLLGEPELDRATIAVDGTIEIRPMPALLDLWFVYMPPAGSLAPTESLQQFGSSAHDLSTNRVIDGDALFRHYLLKAREAKM